MYGYPNQPIILDDSGGGYSHKTLKEATDTAARIAREKADAEWRKILEGWKEKATMLRIHKLALDDTVIAMEEGKVEPNPEATQAYVNKRKYERAKAENFDLDAAEKKYIKKKG